MALRRTLMGVWVFRGDRMRRLGGGWVVGIGLLSCLMGLGKGFAQGRWLQEPVVATENFEAGGAAIRVEFAAGSTDRTREEIVARVRQAADAVSVYYGRFPVRRAGVLIEPRAGDDLGGTTWGDVRGVQGFSRIRFGEHVTKAGLAADWVMTHEMVHMAFPDLERD